MKNRLLLILLFIVSSIKSFSQINFEKGYFINESNQKIECLIKNMDWSNNPTDFEYKLTEDSEIKKASITNTKEFGTYNSSKYIRAQVKIDRSSDAINDLSNERNPIFQDEQLFLKVLIDGDASLFLYLDTKNSQRFFYKAKKDSEIIQLVCKQFITDAVYSNNLYRQQLYNDFKDCGISFEETGKIRYKQWELEDFFKKINKDSNSNYVNYQSKEKKDLFNLTLRPGLKLSSFSMEKEDGVFGKINFDNELSFRFGVEAECILPFNKNKWAVMVEPTFQHYESEKTIKYSRYHFDPNPYYVVKADYASLELPIGIRHYFFINDKSKVFVNAFFMFDFNFDSTIEITNPNESTFKQVHDIESDLSYGLGAGYKFKDKYGLELRYNLGRNIMANQNTWSSNYSSLDFIFGYSFF